MARPRRCDGGEYTAVEIRPGERASDVVVRSVASVTGRDPLALSPLDEWVDPVALDRLVRHASADASGPVAICFDYEGCEVCVVGDEVLVKRR